VELASTFSSDLDQPVFFCAPSRLIIGNGAIAQLGDLLHKLGNRHVLVVTDRFFSQHSPWVANILAQLAGHKILVQVFDQGQADPSVTLCDQASELLGPIHAHQPFDHVVSLGGGSNIDLAKALCLTLAMAQPIRHFVGRSSWDKPPLPHTAIPTTAGTGSEITPGTILVDPLSPTKVAVMGNALRPSIALIDPTLTYSCPPRVTADAGIDALTHAIESLITMDAALFERGGDADPGYSGRNAITVSFAKQAIELIFRWLPVAMQQPQHQQARSAMAYASVYAALSYGSAGLNAVHGLAYALAGITHDTHGSTNAVFLPYVMQSLVIQRQQELAWIAGCAGAASGSEIASQAAPLTRQLIKQVGLRTTLPEFGITQDQLGRIVTDGLAVTRLAKAYPGDAHTAYPSIVQAAFHGTL
jgi:alcohol dehydrogenase